jgi:hypothetical protein
MLVSPTGEAQPKSIGQTIPNPNSAERKRMLRTRSVDRPMGINNFIRSFVGSKCHGVGRGKPMNSDVVLGGSVVLVFDVNGFHDDPPPVVAAVFLG